MDKYQVKLMDRAMRDLEGVYAYIASALMEPGTALALVDAIEKEILSLEELPNRCPLRQRGVYGNKGYRQLFVKNYVVIYRVDEANRQVIIVTVRYARSEF